MHVLQETCHFAVSCSKLSNTWLKVRNLCFEMLFAEHLKTLADHLLTGKFHMQA